MKIVRTAQAVKDFKQRKINANKGCNVCPCCGESRRWVDCRNNGLLNQGIFHGYGYTKYVSYGFLGLKSKLMHIDTYTCETCGAKWESDPYETE